MTANSLTKHTANMHAVSVAEKSSADLTQAIHSAADDEYTLNRTRNCLRLFYDPAMDNNDRAEMIESYRKALSTFPKWSVAKAFDEWERTGTRRPSPADIRILAARAMQPLRDEIKRREREQERAAEAEHVRTDDERASAMRDLSRNGFTPKRMDAVRRKRMAASEAELYAQDAAGQQKHWTQTVAADSPEMAALRKARAENNLIQESMKAGGA